MSNKRNTNKRKFMTHAEYCEATLRNLENEDANTQFDTSLFSSNDPYMPVSEESLRPVSLPHSRSKSECILRKSTNNGSQFLSKMDDLHRSELMRKRHTVGPWHNNGESPKRIGQGKIVISTDDIDDDAFDSESCNDDEVSVNNFSNKNNSSKWFVNNNIPKSTDWTPEPMSSPSVRPSVAPAVPAAPVLLGGGKGLKGLKGMKGRGRHGAHGRMLPNKFGSSFSLPTSFSSDDMCESESSDNDDSELSEMSGMGDSSLENDNVLVHNVNANVRAKSDPYLLASGLSGEYSDKEAIKKLDKIDGNLSDSAMSSCSSSCELSPSDYMSSGSEGRKGRNVRSHSGRIKSAKIASPNPAAAARALPSGSSYVNLNNKLKYGGVGAKTLKKMTYYSQSPLPVCKDDETGDYFNGKESSNGAEKMNGNGKTASADAVNDNVVLLQKLIAFLVFVIFIMLFTQANMMLQMNEFGNTQQTIVDLIKKEKFSCKFGDFSGFGDFIPTDDGVFGNKLLAGVTTTHYESETTTTTTSDAVVQTETVKIVMNNNITGSTRTAHTTKSNDDENTEEKEEKIEIEIESEEIESSMIAKYVTDLVTSTSLTLYLPLAIPQISSNDENANANEGDSDSDPGAENEDNEDLSRLYVSLFTELTPYMAPVIVSSTQKFSQASDDDEDEDEDSDDTMELFEEFSMYNTSNVSPMIDESSYCCNYEENEYAYYGDDDTRDNEPYDGDNDNEGDEDVYVEDSEGNDENQDDHTDTQDDENSNEDQEEGKPFNNDNNNNNNNQKQNDEGDNEDWQKEGKQMQMYQEEDVPYLAILVDEGEKYQKRKNEQKESNRQREMRMIQRSLNSNYQRNNNIQNVYLQSQEQERQKPTPTPQLSQQLEQLNQNVLDRLNNQKIQEIEHLHQHDDQTRDDDNQNRQESQSDEKSNGKNEFSSGDSQDQEKQYSYEKQEHQKQNNDQQFENDNSNNDMVDDNQHALAKQKDKLNLAANSNVKRVLFLNLSRNTVLFARRHNHEGGDSLRVVDVSKDSQELVQTMIDLDPVVQNNNINNVNMKQYAVNAPSQMQDYQHEEILSDGIDLPKSMVQQMENPIGQPDFQSFESRQQFKQIQNDQVNDDEGASQHKIQSLVQNIDQQIKQQFEQDFNQPMLQQISQQISSRLQSTPHQHQHQHHQPQAPQEYQAQQDDILLPPFQHQEFGDMQKQQDFQEHARARVQQQQENNQQFSLRFNMDQMRDLKNQVEDVFSVGFYQRNVAQGIANVKQMLNNLLNINSNDKSLEQQQKEEELRENNGEVINESGFSYSCSLVNLLKSLHSNASPWVLLQEINPNQSGMDQMKNDFGFDDNFQIEMEGEWQMQNVEDVHFHNDNNNNDYNMNDGDQFSNEGHENYQYKIQSNVKNHKVRFQQYIKFSRSVNENMSHGKDNGLLAQFKSFLQYFAKWNSADAIAYIVGIVAILPKSFSNKL